MTEKTPHEAGAVFVETAMNNRSTESATTVAVAGDWHGDRGWAKATLRSLGERGVRRVMHVGDFGVWPGGSGERYLRTVETVCDENDIELLVVPGNHEDWGRLTRHWTRPENQDANGGLLPLRLTDRIAVLPRGWRWVMAGVSFVALGGAPSVDRHRRTRGRDWWPEEQMSQADVDHTVAGGYADIMIAHDAPGPPWTTTPVETILTTNPMDWPDSSLEYATVGRERLTEAFLGVKPRLLVHGHYHCSGEVTVRLPGASHDTTVWSLHMAGHQGNTRLLDLQAFSNTGIPTDTDMTDEP